LWLLGLNGAVWGQANPKLNLSVAYIGHHGSDRESDFVKFLSAHFQQVDSGDLTGFDGSQFPKADVLLLDYDGEPNDIITKGFPRPKLQQDYSRPTLTIGVAGGLICSGLRLKTGYM
jgi:hypothetical protein